MPKLGEAIQLNLQLFDGATNKYVKAWLRNASGVALGTPTVSLSHIGEGLYSNDSVLMPDTSQVTAVYKVFDDAGFTTPSADHADALDIFELDSSGSISNELELSATIETDLLLAALEDC
jgi:hypothetical protein